MGPYEGATLYSMYEAECNVGCAAVAVLVL